ncbi:MAG TPA: EscU/YscU/HrcU family type III secretion system export apparatus switch protein [Polyangiales bacterium]|nr:EscU/YscU/HrcU family type III secretion system export apparatus switch protein [Polyangiales bacterium]
MDDARTEQPTARKLSQARQRGDVALSPSLLAAAALLAALALALWRGPALVAALARLARTGLQAAALAQPRASLALLADPLRDLGWALLPILLVPLAVAWLAGVIQVGPLLAADALRPALQRIDPRSRWQRLWSADRMLEVSYIALAACALLAIVAWSLVRDARALAALASSDHARASSVLASLAADIVLRMSVAAMLFGAIDLVVRRVRARRALRMTRRELAAELRESYGVPEHRTRRERLQREVSVLGALADARLLLIDGAGRVVALGLRSELGPHGANAAREPYLLAKGQGTLALHMRVRAHQSELPVRDHALLVSALFRLEPGAAVPAEHDRALAELFVETSAAMKA